MTETKRSVDHHAFNERVKKLVDDESLKPRQKANLICRAVADFIIFDEVRIELSETNEQAIIRGQEGSSQ